MSKKLAFCLGVALVIGPGMGFGQDIVVTSPAAGDTWRAGENRVVTWTKTGAMDDEVKIRLVQGGSIVLEIADRAPNTGSFPWNIPATVAPGRYVIRVRTLDNAVMDNSGSFTIEAAAAQAPTPAGQGPVALVSPNGKETITLGALFRITWNAVSGGASDRKADLILLREDRPVGVIAENLPLSQRGFAWTAGRLLAGAAEPGSGYKVRIRVDGTTVMDDSDRAFLLTRAASAGSGTGGDLVLVALENSENKVGARIRSTFPRFAGTVMYEMRRPAGAPTPVYRFPLSMIFEEPGEKVYIMETVIPNRETDADFCGKDYEMSLDVTNLVEETNELNNHQAARLFGNPTFVAIDRVWWGTEEVPRGGTLGVRSGEVVRWSNGYAHFVRQALHVNIRNCGYNGVPNGRLCVRQTGSLLGEPGTPSTLRTEELLNREERLPNRGLEQRRMTGELPFNPAESEIRVEYVWEDEGLHTNKAVFIFNIHFRDLPGF